jgi:Leucine-rich repeat (LRR) protein
MFLYILLFLNSCLSTKSRQISSVENDYTYWYIGFDNKLKPEDCYWSPKLYYSPALDNLRKFGTYSYTEKNDQREYLKDRFVKEGGSLFPTLEKLLLMLFPSPSGSLSIRSNSDSNINTFISKLPESNVEDNRKKDILLTKEVALSEILNIVYVVLSSTREEVNKTIRTKSNDESIAELKEKFKKRYNDHKSDFLNINLNIDEMIRTLFNSLKNFLVQNNNQKEKQLIQHAFMKWALMHVGVTNIQKVHTFINRLHFFDSENLNKPQLSKSEELFQQAQIGFPNPDNVYLNFTPFENGAAYAFNKKSKQIDTSFPDCTETTIRHFFNYVLKKDNTYHTFDDFNAKLREYYKNATDEKVLGSDIVSRTTWNKVVANIPGAQYYKEGNELKSNISNILHVIEYLLTNEVKAFKELSSIEEKFKSIATILNKIKPIKLTTYDNEDFGKYIFNNFFIMNINKNRHAAATIQNNNNKNKQETNISPECFNDLEYSFLTKFFTFNIKNSNTIKKDIMPLFHSSIDDITTILHFLKQSNDLNVDDLNHFSSYIGRVLYSTLWDDYTIMDQIYKNDTIVGLLKKIEKTENILNGFQALILNLDEENYNKKELSIFLLKKINVLKKVKILYINNFPSEQLQDLISLIDRKNSIKKASISNQKKEIDEILEAIISSVAIEDIAIHNSIFKNPLPSRLGNLTNLKELNLFTNELSGLIPKELGGLTKLRRLNLSQNQLTGDLPKELGNLIHLEELLLSENQLTGDLKYLDNLINLEIIFLNNNRFTGNISEKLGHLLNLRWFYVSGNQLTGFIPSSLEKYRSMINPQIMIFPQIDPTQPATIQPIKYNLEVEG